MKKRFISFLIIILICLIVIFGGDVYRFFTENSIQEMVKFIQSTGFLAPLVSIGLMIFQAVAAPIPSFLITGANGTIFGVFWGTVVSWIGAMLGALISYLLANRLGFQYVEKRFKLNRSLLEKINGSGGFLFILFSRIIPIVSFDLISFLAGLSGMKLKSFLISTGIGMLPGTIAYTIIGHDILSFSNNAGRIIVVILILLFLSGIAYYYKKKQNKKTA